MKTVKDFNNLMRGCWGACGAPCSPWAHVATATCDPSGALGGRPGPCTRRMGGWALHRRHTPRGQPRQILQRPLRLQTQHCVVRRCGQSCGGSFLCCPPSRGREHCSAPGDHSHHAELSLQHKTPLLLSSAYTHCSQACTRQIAACRCRFHPAAWRFRSWAIATRATQGW